MDLVQHLSVRQIHLFELALEDVHERMPWRSAKGVRPMARKYSSVETPFLEV